MPVHPLKIPTSSKADIATFTMHQVSSCNPRGVSRRGRAIRQMGRVRVRDKGDNGTTFTVLAGASLTPPRRSSGIGYRYQVIGFLTTYICICLVFFFFRSPLLLSFFSRLISALEMLIVGGYFVSSVLFVCFIFLFFFLFFSFIFSIAYSRVCLICFLFSVALFFLCFLLLFSLFLEKGEKSRI